MADPIIVSTWSFARRGHDVAWPALVAGGASLDAIESVCEFVEADPDVDSVGFGGLPDSSGAVTLDACVMLSPSECGSVSGVARHLHVTSIARRVMERTPWVMLTGEGADAFADREGFEAGVLLSPAAEARWRKWLAKPEVVDQSLDAGYHPLRPIDSGAGGQLFAGPGREASARRIGGVGHDTVAVLALDRSGRLAGGCSTSGAPYKMPGRVGDSPIIGQGLYVDPSAGAAAATGTGELIMGTCSSLLVVERMRAGRSPIDAIVEALARIRESFELRPEHQVALIAMTPDGETASAALRPGFKCVRTDLGGTDVIDPDVVLIGDLDSPGR